MRPIRIYFNYQVVDGPWGGANSFLRQLGRAVAAAPDFEIVVSAGDECDLLFLNQLYRGPGRGRWSRKLTTKQQLKRLRQTGYRSLAGSVAGHLVGARRHLPKIVCRLVNPDSNVSGQRSIRERRLLSALELTDVDVFQSEYIRDVFRAGGYRKATGVVIHNGVDPQMFSPRTSPEWSADRPLRLVSCTFSTRLLKRFDLIATASLAPNVEVAHIGNWPEGVDRGQVSLVGKLSQPEIARVYRERADAFLHPAEREACPNAVLEAMSSGLPVLYHPVGGTAELVAESGVAIRNDDVVEAIGRLRSRYPACRLHVTGARPRMSIDVAAERYLDLFRRTMEAA